MARTIKAKQQEETRRRWFRFRLAYIVLLVALGLFAYKFLQKTQEIRYLSRQAAVLRWQNEQRVQQNAELKRAIQFYRTPDFVAEEARAAFGDINPGDVLIQAQPVIQRPVPMLRPAPARPAPTPAPTWKQWWQAFFGGS